MWARIVETLGIAAEAADPDVSTDALRSKNRVKVNAMLQAKLETDTTAHWVAAFNRAGVPCGPVYAMDQVFADEQVRHLGLAWTVPHPRLGDLALVRHPVNIEGVAPPRRPTPDRGEHTEDVLREFGLDAAEISALRENGAI